MVNNANDKDFKMRLLFIIIISLVLVASINSCQTVSDEKSSCPEREVDSWLEESRIVLRENVEVMGMFESSNEISDLRSVVVAAEQVYKHQLQISAPPCLARLDELSEDQFYWMWKYYEALHRGDFTQAEDYYTKATTASEAVEREADRVEKEQEW